MRVIAGSAKGTRLGPVPPGVRPVADRVREGVFSSIGDVTGALVLDLFAGTGAMGIEALSRGAEHATFVERDRRAVRAIEENLRRTGLVERATVGSGDVAQTVISDGDTLAGPFDLAVLDPPYDHAREQVERILDATLTTLRGGGRCIVTRATRRSELAVPVHWGVSRRLEYGDTTVLILLEA